jgi:predicted nucleotidyltransferase
LLRDLRGRLEDLYGERLHAVVLYGSYARGEATPESDVDVMVVLEGEVDAWAEIQRMAKSALEVELEYEEMVTLYPVSQGDFDQASQSVLMRARREGVLV